MEHAHGASALLPAVVLLAAGLAAIAVSKLLKTSAIVGFIVAGMVLGPSGFGLVEETPATDLLAELGVVFLLFEIGLHFSLSELRKNRQDVFTLAPLQALFSGVAFAVLAAALGLAAPVAIAFGGALAISSTAVVLRVLSDRDQRGCPVGSSATSVLIVQDFLAIFLLTYGGSLMVGEQAGMGAIATELGVAALKAVIGFVLVLTIGPAILQPTFRFLARTRNQEAFTACALLLALTLAAASAAAGLSLTLGGFLAGMMIGATHYRHIIETEARPFRGLLLSFFFITVGMKVDVSSLISNFWLILAVTLALMVVKSALNVAAALASRWTLPGAIQIGFLLAQGSEFAFVILALPAIYGELPAQTSSVLISSIALTLALTGVWSMLGLKLARRAAAWRRKPASEPAASVRAHLMEPDEDQPVLVLGTGEVGRRLIDALRRFRVPFAAIETDPDRFMAARADGYDVAFGDPGDMRMMETLGAPRARALAVSNARYEVSVEVSPFVREQFPNLARFVAVDDDEDAERHRAIGMEAVVNRSKPRGLDFAAAVLRFLEVPNEQIGRWMRDEQRRLFEEAETRDETFPSAREPEAA